MHQAAEAGHAGTLRSNVQELFPSQPPNQPDNFVTVDNCTRRHPTGNGTGRIYTLQTGEEVLLDFDPGFVHNVPAPLIRYEFAGFRLDGEERIQQFMVGHTVVKPLAFNEASLYQIEPGKWMVPQQGPKTGAFEQGLNRATACYWMISLEGKTDIHQVSNVEVDFTVLSLGGKEQKNGVDHRRSMLLLLCMMLKNGQGPCFFQSAKFDWVIDAIEEDGEDWFLIDIRDPYHGSCMRIRVEPDYLWGGKSSRVSACAQFRTSAL